MEGLNPDSLKVEEFFEFLLEKESENLGWKWFPVRITYSRKF